LATCRFTNKNQLSSAKAQEGMENEAPNRGVNVSRRARRPRGWWKHVVETKLLPQSTLAAVLPQSTVAAVIEGRNIGVKEWEFQERAGMGQEIL
jgi:hypothetical protein